MVAPKLIWGESFAASGALGMVAAVHFIEGASVGPLVCGEVCGANTVVVLAVGYYGNASVVVIRGA